MTEVRNKGMALAVAVGASACAFGMSEYSPEAFFYVIGGNFSREGMIADLDAISEAGIGGIRFFHGGWNADRPWPGTKGWMTCLSQGWDDAVAFVADECAGRNIKFTMQNCPGWSMSGGPWVTPENAMRRIVAEKPGEHTHKADEDYREICTLAFRTEEADVGARPLVKSVTFPNPQRICKKWSYEPDAELVLLQGDHVVWRRQCPQGAWHDEVDMTFDVSRAGLRGELRGEVRSGHYPAKSVKVVCSSERKLDNWEAKAGWAQRGFTMSADTTPAREDREVRIRFGHVRTWHKNGPAPEEGTGWECNKMDRRGIAAVWNGYLGRLTHGKLRGGKLKGVQVDSWECGVQTWTESMEADFEKLNGYALRPWLPALFGYILRSEAETERFLLDWRRTCSRLIEENYYGAISRLAHENGQTIEFETAFGDVLPGDLLRFWKYADAPMCEFWSPFDNCGGHVYSHDYKPVRPCVSAAHVYGKKRVSAESFTSFNLTFDESFQELKENANRHFARGITHLVLHAYTHNPSVDGLPPGTSFGRCIGTPFLRLQRWWKYMPQFTGYLETCCRELERGKPVVDILWYLGDAFGHKPSEREDLFGGGYKYDYLNNDALMTRVDVNDGRLVLPDGMSYRVLWVPTNTFLLAESRAKILELEKRGARVVFGELRPDWPAQAVAEGDGGIFWYERTGCGTNTYFIAARDDKPFRGRVRLRDVPGEFTLDLSRGESTFIRTGDGPCVVPREKKAMDLRVAGVQSFHWTKMPDERVTLDLGKVCHWATVSVNGKVAAKLWCEPYRCDITDLLQEGENELTIDVTETWYNDLVRDAAKPEADRKTWTIAGPKAGAPLHDAGLYGPVRLLAVVKENENNRLK